ncbi:MAG: hypothetical protein J7545_15560 [Roseofilum sp. SBFL]|uniref:hypothetical protein n=1 Tax=Roseofilum sp. SBFL TaxID=2821496 RepID=UPI001B26053D|nr:hypothetical protein [Roseofilum sp. SBFL]MBP0043364.1 hypothetical protein [Roseofilum sp. SBFL]
MDWNFTDWAFVQKAAPVIFIAVYKKGASIPLLESEKNDLVQEAVDIAVKMSRSIRLRQEEMETHTGLPTPKHHQRGNF